jgi:hypothetical protein
MKLWKIFLIACAFCLGTLQIVSQTGPTSQDGKPNNQKQEPPKRDDKGSGPNKPNNPPPAAPPKQDNKGAGPSKPQSPPPAGPPKRDDKGSGPAKPQSPPPKRDDRGSGPTNPNNPPPKRDDKPPVSPQTPPKGNPQGNPPSSPTHGDNPPRNPDTNPNSNPPVSPNRGSDNRGNTNSNGNTNPRPLNSGDERVIQGRDTNQPVRPKQNNQVLRTETGPAFNPRTSVIGGLVGQGRNQFDQNNKGSNVELPTYKNDPMSNNNFIKQLPRQNQTPQVIPVPNVGNNHSGGGAGKAIHKQQIADLKHYSSGSLRHGYYSYDPFWKDCHFGYSYYIFYPTVNCWFSPYYWYMNCPPYISYHRIFIYTPRVIIIIGDTVPWWYCGKYYAWSNYGYSYSYRDYSRYSILDRALSNLVDAFKYSDVTLLDPLLPRNNRVDIFIDGSYSYSVNSDDYYDMTADLIHSVYTVDFNIIDVRRTRGNEYKVIAKHDYLDPWNARQSTYLTFTLENQRGNLVIVEAGTSRFRPFW